MAKAISPITLASACNIPFDKLVLSQSNVRRVKSGMSLKDLAQSIIARRGLIQSLHVRPVLGKDGQETGFFEVPAGGRRFRALELLVKQKRLARNAPVPCIVSQAGAASGVHIAEVSLAENIERAPLHPLDQFSAIQTLRDEGMTEEASGGLSRRREDRLAAPAAVRPQECAHHGDPTTHSMNIRPAIPRPSDHPFQPHPTRLI